mmetsp:Transcript_5920/g.19480  ORF Transcript_5920/g.19480 Transcript_5920/m.19480 type:complete len:217 (-) Transcript_5920:1001-1651(-)
MMTENRPNGGRRVIALCDHMRCPQCPRVSPGTAGSSPRSIFVAGSYMLDGRMLGRGHDRRMRVPPHRASGCLAVHPRECMHRRCGIVRSSRLDRPPTAHLPPSPPLPPLLPLLPVGRRPLFLVVLLLDLGPVGGEHLRKCLGSVSVESRLGAAPPAPPSTSCARRDVQSEAVAREDGSRRKRLGSVSEEVSRENTVPPDVWKDLFIARRVSSDALP